MPTVVGVKLRFTPKQLWFDPSGTTPEVSDSVIVETERGVEFGHVTAAAHEVTEAELVSALKPIMRIAGPEDLAYEAELEDKEREAMPVFREVVAEYKLDMKAVDVEFLFGGDKVVFYFVAEERVDFREMVKELANRFHARIDMRQVGVRDEARMVGGLGHCGEQLCCVRFGGEFQPVSIRMAKEQDLPLNPLKISGLCGRLMCCLRYEFEAYKDFKSRAPKKGTIVETPLGLAKVSELNTPRETIGMRFEDGNRVTIPLAEMGCCKGTGCPCSVSRESLEMAGGTGTALALAALDREEEAAAAPPAPAPKRRSGGGERPPSARTSERSKPSERAKPSEDAAEAPKAEGAGRKRRRRGGRGGGEGAAAGEAQAARTTEGAQAPKAAEKSTAEKPAAAAASGEAAAPKSGRRRRRRRPGSGGGGTDAS